MTKEEDVVLVIIRKPGEPPYPWFLPRDGDIKPLQKLVGGLFQIMPGDAIGLPDQVDLWCGEEGKMQGLESNIDIGFDIIVGTAVFKAATEDGRSRNLSDQEIVKVTEWLKERML